MMRSKDDRHDITKNDEPFPFMNKLKEKDQTSGLTILRSTTSNPSGGIRLLKSPITKMTSTQIGSEIQIDSINEIDQATFGLLDPTRDSKPKKISMPGQRRPIVRTIRTFQSNNLPTPNIVQFIDNHDTNMINDLLFCNRARDKKPHTFQFEDCYDFLCYKLYLQDIEGESLKLKNERKKLFASDHTEDTKPLIETQGQINCLGTESPNTTSVSSTPTLNKGNRSEPDELLEESFEEKETDTTHIEERDSDFRIDESKILQIISY